MARLGTALCVSGYVPQASNIDLMYRNRPSRLCSGGTRQRFGVPVKNVNAIAVDAPGH